METHKDIDESEWLKLRHQNINSTESPALFGLSPYSTEFELYHRKKANEPYGISDNFRMKVGRLIEPVIARLALDEIMCEGQEFKDYVCLPKVRMGSSFDWIVTEGEYAGWLIECKNVDFIQYRDKWTEFEAPVHIETQVQHQMHVCNAPGTIIACLVGGNELKLIFRDKDEGFGRALEKKIAEFWDGFDNNREPEINFRRDAEIISELYSNAVAGEIYDTEEDDDCDESIAMLENYQKWGNEIKFLKAQQQSVKAVMLQKIGTASKVRAGNFSISCGVTKDTPPKLITEDMVGQEIGGRKGYRMFKVTKKEEK